MNLSYDEVSRLTQSPKLNEGEKSLLKWQYNMHGDFFTGLWKAISHADLGNLARLKLAFPEHVIAYEAFTGCVPYDFVRKCDLILGRVAPTLVNLKMREVTTPVYELREAFSGLVLATIRCKEGESPEYQASLIAAKLHVSIQ